MTTDNGYAPNVVLALCRVMDELPGIGKGMRSPQGYDYRGIEQLTPHAQALFAKHGVVLAPRHVEWRETVQLSINNKPWTDEKLMVHYRCYGPGGAEDYIDIETPGIGRDNADKGSNKAMSQAFKYALLQTLCIGDARDDSDREHHEADADAEPTSAERVTVTQDEADALAARLDDENKTPPAVAASFKEWKQEQGVPWPWPRTAYMVMLDKLADMLLDHETADAQSRSKAPESAEGGTTPPQPAEEATDEPGRNGETPAPAATAEEAQTILAELEHRNAVEADVKATPIIDVRAALVAANLDGSGKAAELRERLVEHLLHKVAS